MLTTHSYPLTQTCRLIRSEFLPLCENMARSPHILEIEVIEFDFSLLSRYVRDIYRRTPAVVNILVTIRLTGSPIGLPLPATAQIWKLQDFIDSTVLFSPIDEPNSYEGTPDRCSTSAEGPQTLEGTMQFKLDVNRTIYKREALEDLVEKIVHTFAGTSASGVVIAVGQAVTRSLCAAGYCEHQPPHGTNDFAQQDSFKVALCGKRRAPGKVRSHKPSRCSCSECVRRYQATNGR